MQHLVQADHKLNSHEKEIATFFMDTVDSSSHAYATGGTSVREFW
jgi:hypothetical protein